MNNSWLTIEREGQRVVLKKCSQEAEGMIIIPDGVTDIAKMAFSQCNKICEVHIPNSVIRIGALAFQYCHLTSLHIPANVTCLETNAVSIWFIATPFYGNGHLLSITVDKSNPVYDSRNNCNAIIETSTNRLIFGCKNTTIPDSVSVIGSTAFFGLNSPMSIPEGVKVIEHSAFYDCFLPYVLISNSQTKLKRTSFRGSTIVIRGGVTIKDERYRNWDSYLVKNHGLSHFEFSTPRLRNYYTKYFYDQLKFYFCQTEDMGNYIQITRLDDDSNKRLADEVPGNNAEESFMFASIFLYMIIAQQSIVKIAPEAEDDFHRCMGWSMINSESNEDLLQDPLEILRTAGLSPKIYEIPLFLEFVKKTFYIFRVEMNTLLKGTKSVMKDLDAGERFVKIVKGHKGSRIKKYLDKQENNIINNLKLQIYEK